MFKSYLKTIWRNLWKNKSYSIINITGLAMGLTGFLVILLYLNHELSYDTWHDALKQVYKVSLRTDEEPLKNTPAPLAIFLKENAPGIAAATSISSSGSFEMLVSYGDKQLYQRGTISADSSFFKVFPYKMVQGNAATAMDKPNAMVLSEEVARKLFGNTDPIGKMVRVYNAFDCEVTAVMQRPKRPSHLEAEIIYRAPYEKSNLFWQNFSFRTYVRTNIPLAAETLEKTVDRVYYEQRLKNEKKRSFEDFRKAGHLEGLFVDPVQQLHNFPKYGSSNIGMVSALLVLSVLLLLAGAINFSNLSIAASMRRAREIGIKKVLGSSQSQLFWQFMGEIAFQCLLGLALALLLTALILPYFNREFNILLDWASLALPLAVQVLVSLMLVVALSGLYPAVFLSRYNTSLVLKGDFSRGTKGIFFRNLLVVVQFAVSTFFIISTIAVSRQLEFMQNRDKGFSGEQVLRIQATQRTREEGFETLRNTLLSIPGVAQVSKSTTVPGDEWNDTTTISFKYEAREYRMSSVKVSAEYFNTLGIALQRGRLFDNSYTDQHTRSAVINHTAAQKLGVKNLDQAYLTFPGCDSIPVKIVGVVKDFNVSGYETHVQPVVYTIGNQACRYQSGGAILVKLSGDDLRKPVAAVEQVLKQTEPGFPPRLTFLDDNFQLLFVRYIRLQKIINFFGLTAILIAMMGLFGLTAFLTRQRTKEIGIRKVLGASIADLSFLLSRNFVGLVLAAIAIAIPPGWWAIHQWLAGFAYRMAPDTWLFVVSAVAVLLIAVFTVNIHTLRAASANPVNSLRNNE